MKIEQHSDQSAAKPPVCELPGPLLQFKVDGDKYQTHATELLPNDIIKDFAGVDPATHYIVEIDGKHKVSFEGKGNIPIKMRDHMKFQVICTGPMTVSDPEVSAAVMAFLSGLVALGYEPKTLPGKPDHVVIDYEVQTGKHAGLKLQQGFVIPADFPVSPPSGPHVAAELHPDKSGGDHPTGGINRNSAAAFEAVLGGKWQYWSRPFLGWGVSKKPVASYMTHIWRLWDSQ